MEENDGAMRTLVLTLYALASAGPAFAQGTIVFNNRVTGQVVFHVYGPNTNNINYDSGQIGNGPNDYPSGTTDWSTYQQIGATGSGGELGAATTLAQLLAAPGSDQPEFSLIPASPITTFRTGAAAGFVASTMATLANVAPDAAAATVEMVVWDNSSGFYPTWALARDAWISGQTIAGVSGAYNVFQIGGTLNTPPNLIGFQSFNIHWSPLAGPEPSSTALGAFGAGLVMIALQIELKLGKSKKQRR